MLEYVEVRVNHIDGRKSQFKVELPQDRRDNNTDTINDIVGDYLYEKEIKYRWFRVLVTCLAK